MWTVDGHLGYDPDDTDPESWLRSGFPARYIYEKILPEVVAEHSPGTAYRRGSPYGNAMRPDGGALTIGDTHQWSVWHGSQAPYQDFGRLAGRFVSEFGMQAYPHVTTIDAFLPQLHPGAGDDTDPGERAAGSATVEFHNKASGAARRLAGYLAENLAFDEAPLEAFVYSTQLLQAEALATAFRLWRRNWQGPGRELTSGALVWQLNDCWPAASWAIVDHLLRPKAAFYAIRRELAPVVLAAQRRVVTTPRDRYTHAHVIITYRLAVWLSVLPSSLPSSRQQQQQQQEEEEEEEKEEGPGLCRLVSKAFDVASGQLLVSETIARDILLPTNRSIELADVLVPGVSVAATAPQPPTAVVVVLYLLGADGRHVARCVSWPDPLKHVPLHRHPQISALLWRGVLRLRVDRPVKGLVVEGRPSLELEDNGVDLLPGEIYQIDLVGAEDGGGDTGDSVAGELTVRFYGGGERGATVAVQRVHSHDWSGGDGRLVVSA